MVNLMLKLKREHEPGIDGWVVADGHWDMPPGIGVLLIVASEKVAQLEKSEGMVELVASLVHCANVLIARNTGKMHGATDIH